MRLMTRLALLGLFAIGVYWIGSRAPGAFEDPVAVTVLALVGAFVGGLLLRGGDRRMRRPEIRRSRNRFYEGIGRVAFPLAIWGAVVSGFFLFSQPENRVQGTAFSTRASAAPTGFAGIAQDTISVLNRDHGGHFVAPVYVNGRHVKMLVDTGSSDIALPYAEAVQLGINVDALNFNSPVMTANGQAMVAPVTLATVAVDGIILNDVRASIAEPGKLGSALLGMSFLGALEEVSLRGNELTLRQ